MHMTKTGSDKNCDLNSNVIDIDFNWNRVVVDMRKWSSTCSRVKKLVPISRMNYSHMMYDLNVEIIRISKSDTHYDIDAIITETYNLVTAANLIIIKTNQV